MLRMLGDVAVILILSAMVAVPPLLTRGILGWRPGWSGRAVSLVTACLVPTCLVALAILVVMRTHSMTFAQCGIDACGMMIAAAMMLASVAVVVFAVGLILNARVLSTIRRSGKAQGANTTQ